MGGEQGEQGDIARGSEAFKRWLLAVCWCCKKVGLNLLQSGKRFLIRSLLFRFQSYQSRERPLWFCIRRRVCVLDLKSKLMSCGRVFDHGTEQERHARWESTRENEREDGKHPLRPLYHTWAVRELFKTLLYSRQTLHIWSRNISDIIHLISDWYTFNRWL